jgi:hypothetical protein
MKKRDRRVSLRAKYHLFKELTNFLDVLEYLLLGGGLVFAVNQDLQSSIALFALMGIVRWGNSELNQFVNQLQIRLELERRR